MTAPATITGGNVAYRQGELWPDDQSRWRTVPRWTTALAPPYRPTVTTQCADCGLGTRVAGEWYGVKNKIWEMAWAGRRKSWHVLPGQQILCIGCLEARLGRTLLKRDFINTMVDIPFSGHRSERLRDRLAAVEVFDIDAALERAAGTLLAELPAEKQRELLERWHAMDEQWDG